MKQYRACHKCTDRYPACHDHCEKYQQELQEHIAEYRMIKDKRKEEVEFIQAKSKSITKRLRKQLGKG